MELCRTSTMVKACVQEEHDLARGQFRMWASGMYQGRQGEDYGRLSETRILRYDDPWGHTADVSNVVGKLYNLCRVKTIRIAGVHGHGQLVRPHQAKT